MGKHMKLTEQERATIIDALTVAACQYVRCGPSCRLGTPRPVDERRCRDARGAVSTDRRRRKTTTRQDDVLVGAP